MRVLIAPLSDDELGSAGYASDLVEALRGSDACRPPVQAFLGAPEDGRQSDADLIHVIADNPAQASGSWHAVAQLCANAPCVLTVLDVLEDASADLLSVCGPHSTFVVLTETARTRLLRHGALHGDVATVPTAVPPAEEIGPFDAAPTILVMAPRPPHASLLDEAIGALLELPRNISIRVATVPSLADLGTVEQATRMAAARHRAADRVEVVAMSTRQAVQDAIATAAAVIVTRPVVAGPWHAFAPLAHGIPILAPRHDLFTDLMLRGHCVRTFDTDKPGHLGACLRAILGNPIGLEEIRERGMRFAATHSPAHMAQQMAAVYSRAIAAEPHGGPS